MEWGGTRMGWGGGAGANRASGGGAGASRARGGRAGASKPRLGGMYGPDVTFLGIPRADLADPDSWSGADVLIISAPFDGGTSHRPGATFGPPGIPRTASLPPDRARPHLPPI